MPQNLNWKFLKPSQERNLEYPDISKSQQKLIDPYNKLPIYLPRIQTTRFPNLHQDEEILANIALIWKDLLKSSLEGFYGYSLDNIEFDNQIRSMTKDKYGGIDYYNYEFSDSYDDEDRKTDRPLGPGMENYAKLSVHDAIEKYWPIAEGWEDCVMMMGFWYEKNIHTYQLGNSNPAGGPCNLFPDPYTDHVVRDDCTGYVCACILYYAATTIYPDDKDLCEEIFKGFSWPPSSEAWSAENGAAQQTTEKAGFEIIPYSMEATQPFDIVMGNMKFGKCQGHHGEIYAGTFGGRRRSWGWGGVHDEAKGGMPAGFVNYNYDWIFRMKGIKKYTDQEAEEMIEEARKTMSIPDGSNFYNGKTVGSNNSDASQKANG